MLREIAGPAGPLEALLEEPAAGSGVNRNGLVEHGRGETLRAAVVFGHPHPQYGGTMHTKAVFQSAKALARIGCAVLRFKFRGVGRSAGTFDAGVGEQDDFAPPSTSFTRIPGVPLWAAGMSFGSWVGLSFGADPRFSALDDLDAPSRYEFTPVAESPKPKFFIQAERDEICPLKEARELYARAAEPKELVIIDGADHVFEGKASEVADALEDLLGDWT